MSVTVSSVFLLSSTFRLPCVKRKRPNSYSEKEKSKWTGGSFIFHFLQAFDAQLLIATLRFSEAWTLCQSLCFLCNDEELFFETSVRCAPHHTLSKLYDMPVGFVTSPPHLRQCLALFAVAEGWLLLNIIWFVLLYVSIIAWQIKASAKVYQWYRNVTKEHLHDKRK